MNFALATLTIAHVAVSLVGIGSGFVVAYGFLTAKRLDTWTAIFLWTNVATSASGFLFPVDRLLPSHVLSILSLVALTIAIVARYPRQLAGAWRSTYVISSVIALYFNVFVLIVQSFMKVPVLHALAPTQAEPPFAVIQLVTLASFIVFGFVANRRFRNGEVGLLAGR